MPVESKLFERYHQENLQRLTRIETQNESMEEKMDDLKKELFGNGQPGHLQVMKAEIRSLQEDRWRVIGAVGAILFVIQFLTGGGIVSLKSLLK